MDLSRFVQTVAWVRLCQRAEHCTECPGRGAAEAGGRQRLEGGLTDLWVAGREQFPTPMAMVVRQLMVHC